jgi:hypothetical protein
MSDDEAQARLDNYLSHMLEAAHLAARKRFSRPADYPAIQSHYSSIRTQTF